MIDKLKKDIEYVTSTCDYLRKSLETLELWIKTTSKCSKCNGNPYKTVGGTICIECGLEGKQPWGG